MRSGVSLSDIKDPSRFFTNEGDPIGIQYSPVIEDGEVVLKVSAKFSIPDFINSYADSCDMSFIIARLKAGDSSVLNVVPANFGDTTIFPDNRAAMLQTVIDAQNTWDHLSPDIKSRFDDDFHSWFAQAGSEDWVSKMQKDLQEFGRSDTAAIAGQSAARVDQPVFGTDSTSIPAQEV